MQGATVPVGLPVTLIPTLRLRALVPGIDVAERIRALYAALVPSLDPSILDARVAAAASAAPLHLTKPEVLALAVRPGVAVVLQRARDDLLATLTPLLPAPVGADESTFVTCLTEAQGGFGTGTIVVQRSTSDLVEQFVLTRVRVDLQSGKASLDLPRIHAPPAAPPRVLPMADDGGTVKILHGVIGVALSVTPFLPPP